MAAQSKEAATQKLATIGEETKKVGSTSVAVQQSDNVAHALAGAGGGLLSMALT
jgi:solute carrier family 25 (peroxisomal adenine nucleotide transporter), member 17